MENVRTFEPEHAKLRARQNCIGFRVSNAGGLPRQKFAHRARKRCWLNCIVRMTWQWIRKIDTHHGCGLGQSIAFMYRHPETCLKALCQFARQFLCAYDQDLETLELLRFSAAEVPPQKSWGCD